jgi:hypothetical protein
VTLENLGSSFRDPSGQVFRHEGTLLRSVAETWSGHYDHLLASGLYTALTERGWLVKHEEVQAPPGLSCYRTLRPELIPYISYPYEWCFSQLKDAALLTLDIQLLSLSHGMGLKDASAYNVQFIGSRPVFIDTLSFATYREGEPWIAYRQFCQHFLAPLALMAYRDPRLRSLLLRFIDGIPLELTSALLPRRSRLRFGMLSHIHLHAKSQRRHESDAGPGEPVARIPSIPRSRLIALMHSLRAAVAGLQLPGRRTEWGAYYGETNYSDEAMSAKEALVVRLVEEHAPAAGLIHDLGANTGRFSRLVAARGRYVVSHDIDEMAVEANYAEGRRSGDGGVLPLVLDLTSPAPAIGWNLEERESALSRIEGGTVLALAVIHHLAISNNVPLPHLADFFARCADTLIIEFVPKDDSQVRRLLATREDVFPEYRIEAFERAFSRCFVIQGRFEIPGSSRTMFAMEKKPSHVSGVASTIGGSRRHRATDD